MAPPVELLTYEDLSTVCRSEQKSKNLTEVRKDFYPAIRECKERLKNDYERENASNPFSTKAKLANKAHNEFQDLVELTFEARMKKILAMALRAAEGNKIETNRLTIEEKEIFDSIFTLMKDRHASLLEGQARKPEVSEEPAMVTKVPDMIVEASREAEEFDSTTLPKEGSAPAMMAAPPTQAPEAAPGMKVAPSVTVVKPEITVKATDAPPATVVAALKQEPPVPATVVPTGDYVVLRILEDIPAFAGPDRNYKLQKEDLVSLPLPIAKALIARKKAIGVQPPDLK